MMLFVIKLMLLTLDYDYYALCIHVKTVGFYIKINMKYNVCIHACTCV